MNRQVLKFSDNSYMCRVGTEAFVLNEDLELIAPTTLQAFELYRTHAKVKEVNLELPDNIESKAILFKIQTLLKWLDDSNDEIHNTVILKHLEDLGIISNNTVFARNALLELIE